MLAALLMTALPGVASAQAPLQENTWMVTVGAGVALDPDANASLALSGAAAYPLSKRFAVEGELGHVLDLSPDDVDVDTSLTNVHGSLLYFFNTDYVLTPYVAGGIGIANYSVDDKTSSNDFSTTEFGFNLGAGVMYPFSNATSFRGDFRFLKHIDNVPSVWRFTAGISLRIGS